MASHEVSIRRSWFDNRNSPTPVYNGTFENFSDASDEVNLRLFNLDHGAVVNMTESSLYRQSDVEYAGMLTTPLGYQFEAVIRWSE